MGKFFTALEKAGQNDSVDLASAERRAEIKARDFQQAPTAADDSRPAPDPQSPRRLFDQAAMEQDLVCYFKPRSNEADKINALRNKIFFPEEGLPPHTVMVTSAFPGEGKTFIAANLAVSIAQAGHSRVLIMDCDIGRCSLQARFGFGSVPGLAEYLAGQAAGRAQFFRTAVPGLFMLPGGEPAAHAPELLVSRKMVQLMDEVAVRYRDHYVLLDAPPLLTAEANALARQVDAVVVVIKYGRTPRRAVADMIENLGRDRIVGIVLNGVETDVDKTNRYLRKYRGYRH